jgi:hypothetical protein
MPSGHGDGYGERIRPARHMLLALLECELTLSKRLFRMPFFAFQREASSIGIAVWHRPLPSRFARLLAATRQYRALPGVRGNGIASRTLASPVT